MEFKEAREKYLQAWGTLGSSWGINRTMAQIHALLLISPAALSTEEVMEELNISRGNANMNIRALMDWQLVQKELKSGERKEYFSAEKDIWKISKKIMEQRKRRELEPVLRALEEVSQVKSEKGNEEIKAFKEGVKNIHDFASMVDNMMDKMIRKEKNIFLNTILKLLK